MLVASLALFVALGGPAQAKRLINGADIRKGTVRSAQIADRTIATRDVSATALRALRETPDATITEPKLAAGSVSAAKLAAGAVIAGKLGAGAVGAPALADNAVTGAKVADGTLSAADVARFSGRFRVTPESVGTIDAHSCWSGEPRGLAPEAAGADISQDLVVVAPLSAFNERALTFSYRMAVVDPADPLTRSRFVLALCNVTDVAVPPPSTGLAFSYIVFDVP